MDFVLKMCLLILVSLKSFYCSYGVSFIKKNRLEVSKILKSDRPFIEVKKLTAQKIEQISKANHPELSLIDKQNISSLLSYRSIADSWETHFDHTLKVDLDKFFNRCFDEKMIKSILSQSVTPKQNSSFHSLDNMICLSFFTRLKLDLLLDIKKRSYVDSFLLSSLFQIGMEKGLLDSSPTSISDKIKSLTETEGQRSSFLAFDLTASSKDDNSVHWVIFQRVSKKKYLLKIYLTTSGNGVVEDFENIDSESIQNFSLFYAEFIKNKKKIDLDQLKTIIKGRSYNKKVIENIKEMASDYWVFKDFIDIPLLESTYKAFLVEHYPQKKLQKLSPLLYQAEKSRVNGENLVDRPLSPLLTNIYGQPEMVSYLSRVSRDQFDEKALTYLGLEEIPLSLRSKIVSKSLDGDLNKKESDGPLKKEINAFVQESHVNPMAKHFLDIAILSENKELISSFSEKYDGKSSLKMIDIFMLVKKIDLSELKDFYKLVSRLLNSEQKFYFALYSKSEYVQSMFLEKNKDFDFDEYSESGQTFWQMIFFDKNGYQWADKISKLQPLKIDFKKRSLTLNDEGSTTLHYLLKHDFNSLFVLEHYSNRDEIFDVINIKDNKGDTPFCTSPDSGFYSHEIAKRYSSKIETMCGDGDNILHRAIKKRFNIDRSFFKLQGLINERNKDGLTPLQLLIDTANQYTFDIILDEIVFKKINFEELYIYMINKDCLYMAKNLIIFILENGSFEAERVDRYLGLLEQSYKNKKHDLISYNSYVDSPFFDKIKKTLSTTTETVFQEKMGNLSSALIRKLSAKLLDLDSSLMGETNKITLIKAIKNSFENRQEYQQLVEKYVKESSDRISPQIISLILNEELDTIHFDFNLKWFDQGGIDLFEKESHLFSKFSQTQKKDFIKRSLVKYKHNPEMLSRCLKLVDRDLHLIQYLNTEEYFDELLSLAMGNKEDLESLFVLKDLLVNLDPFRKFLFIKELTKRYGNSEGVLDRFFALLGSKEVLLKVMTPQDGFLMAFEMQHGLISYKEFIERYPYFDYNDYIPTDNQLRLGWHYIFGHPNLLGIYTLLKNQKKISISGHIADEELNIDFSYKNKLGKNGVNILLERRDSQDVASPVYFILKNHFPPDKKDKVDLLSQLLHADNRFNVLTFNSILNLYRIYGKEVILNKDMDTIAKKIGDLSIGDFDVMTSLFNEELFKPLQLQLCRNRSHLPLIAKRGNEEILKLFLQNCNSEHTKWVYSLEFIKENISSTDVLNIFLQQWFQSGIEIDLNKIYDILYDFKFKSGKIRPDEIKEKMVEPYWSKSILSLSLIEDLERFKLRFDALWSCKYLFVFSPIFKELLLKLEGEDQFIYVYKTMIKELKSFEFFELFKKQIELNRMKVVQEMISRRDKSFFYKIFPALDQLDDLQVATLKNLFSELQIKRYLQSRCGTPLEDTLFNRFNRKDKAKICGGYRTRTISITNRVTEKKSIGNEEISSDGMTSIYLTDNRLVILDSDFKPLPTPSVGSSPLFAFDRDSHSYFFMRDKFEKRDLQKISLDNIVQNISWGFNYVVHDIVLSPPNKVAAVIGENDFTIIKGNDKVFSKKARPLSFFEFNDSGELILFENSNDRIAVIDQNGVTQKIIKDGHHHKPHFGHFATQNIVAYLDEGWNLHLIDLDTKEKAEIDKQTSCEKVVFSNDGDSLYCINNKSITHFDVEGTNLTKIKKISLPAKYKEFYTILNTPYDRYIVLEVLDSKRSSQYILYDLQDGAMQYFASNTSSIVFSKSDYFLTVEDDSHTFLRWQFVERSE